MLVSQLKDILAELIFTLQRGREHRRIIAVDRDHQPFFEIPAYGMPSQIIKAACTYVAAHADLDRDLPFRKHAHQLGICICIQPVTNALGADVQRSPDRLRPRRLPGVCCEMQAMIFGLRVNFLEKLWRGSALVSADPNSNDVALLVLNCLVKYLGSGFNSEMADGVKNPEQRNYKIAFPA